MGLIYVARHGQDEDNAREILNGRRDTPLTELGKTQAQELAQKVAHLNIDFIVTSPLQRAIETGIIVRRRLGMPADRQYPHLKLIERDYGVLTGRPKSDIFKLGRNLLHTEHTTYFLEADGAEHYVHVFKRAERVLNDVERLHRNHNVLLACHGDVGNMIRAVFYGLPWSEALTRYGRFMNCDVFELSQKVKGGRLI